MVILKQLGNQGKKRLIKKRIMMMINIKDRLKVKVNLGITLRNKSSNNRIVI